MIAVKDSDNPSDKYFHVTKVKAINDEQLHVRYYGTTKKAPTKARFKPMWFNPKRDRLMLSKPRMNAKALLKNEYTGTLGMVEGNLPPAVVLKRVVLKQGKMSEACWKELEQAGLNHHVAGVTYS